GHPHVRRNPMSSHAAAGHGSRVIRPDLDRGPTTTAGVIAIGNLQARIGGLTWQATRSRLTGDGWAELVELTTWRGHVLGCIAGAERAVALADAFVAQSPADPGAFVARARTAAVFHRFPAALADLDAAAGLGLDRRTLEGERAAVFQAVGRADEALAVRRRA